MTTPTELERIERKLPVIREYLKGKFPGYVLVEVADRGDHKFAVINEDLGKHHKLRVLWIRLSERGNSPMRIQAELKRDHVAEKMVQAPNYFTW